MLPDATRRRAADLLNVMDLLVRRRLPALGEPWDLNLKQLWLWREKLVDIAVLLEKADAIAQALLTDPFALLGFEAPTAPEPEEASEEPEEHSEGEAADDSLAVLTPAKSPFNESLIDYALTEYVVEEERALEEEAAERSELELFERKSRVVESIQAFREHNLQVPQELVEELRSILDEEKTRDSNDGDASPEMQELLDAPTPEAEGEDVELIELSIEERVEIFRECHADTQRVLKEGIARLGEWVREAGDHFRAI